ncbi:MAG: formylglycine-generating enzyme family protein [Gammaproteobacteria bacterium]|nr:formylglycine-generating enzyme family protein [Gammaproteobacteria bacterium]
MRKVTRGTDRLGGARGPFRAGLFGLAATLAIGLAPRVHGLGSESAAVCDGRFHHEVNGPNGHARVWIETGRFHMGDAHGYVEEGPVVERAVDGFWMDSFAVTNGQFAAFVEATGYVTVAERKGLDFDAAQSVGDAGAAVFRRRGDSPTSQRQPGYWTFVPGASWRHPDGPGSTIEGAEHFPVVQVAFEDAAAYATWVGAELPSEVQWEYAARGGLASARYAWGDEFQPEGRFMANTWQGEFPFIDEGLDGFPGLAPVGCFAANGFGLYDMIGNVWEWTTTAFHPKHRPEHGAGAPEQATQTVTDPTAEFRVIKGGSHLCAANACRRYRPGARQPAEADLGTNHIGFRTIVTGARDLPPVASDR